MLYIRQSHKNQLLRLHPAVMNQDFIICSLSCFSPIGGYQLSKFYNNAKSTHVQCLIERVVLSTNQPKKLILDDPMKSYKQIQHLSTLHIECLIAFSRYNCTEKVKQLLSMI